MNKLVFEGLSVNIWYDLNIIEHTNTFWGKLMIDDVPIWNLVNDLLIYLRKELK